MVRTTWKVRRNDRKDGMRQKNRIKIKKPKNAIKNRWTNKSRGSSASAKKLKSSTMQDVLIDDKINYRILDFFAVFSVISQYVKCKTCGNDIKFNEAAIRGLGFKIEVRCTECKPVLIPSSPYINSGYEINRRLIFAMRMIGVGLSGVRKFCGLMDLPAPVAQTTYDKIVHHIYDASKRISDIFFQKAVQEEKQETAKHTKDSDCIDLIVSGDGSWRKRGFSSLYGIASLIGNYSGKVVDIIIKSSFCKACSLWTGKQESAEYEEWYTEHEANCGSNHEGSAGKMEVDAVTEMFSRSLGKYGVSYTNYIGDGDSKTFGSIVSSNPYGSSHPIKKRECIGHVQKRMGRRLRDLKKKTKGLSGRNKLTASLIDKLTVYYGLAIRRNHHSLKKMADAIWATFYHVASTDKKPQHHLCPKGSDSWCTWQKAKAARKLKYYKHEKELDKNVIEAIQPIYADLSRVDLLERCLGGFNQNNNKGLNNLIWKIAPKTMHSGVKIVEIAALTSSCIFNEGIVSLLHIMNAMEIRTGVNCHNYAVEEDQRRVSQGNNRALESTKESRVARRQSKIAENNAEDTFYGAGIDDAW